MDKTKKESDTVIVWKYFNVIIPPCHEGAAFIYKANLTYLYLQFLGFNSFNLYQFSH